MFIALVSAESLNILIRLLILPYSLYFKCTNIRWGIHRCYTFRYFFHPLVTQVIYRRLAHSETLLRISWCSPSFGWRYDVSATFEVEAWIHWLSNRASSVMSRRKWELWSGYIVGVGIILFMFLEVETSSVSSRGSRSSDISTALLVGSCWACQLWIAFSELTAPPITVTRKKLFIDWGVQSPHPVDIGSD